MHKRLNINFYQNIAKLFYAIAASDKVVRDEEFCALKEIVKREWLSVDDTEDKYNTDSAYQIEIVFDWLTTKELDAKTCYDEFIAYKNEHYYFFTEEMNSLILKTAGTIASAFAKQNKSELIMLANLNMDLKQRQL
ncbi:hypothetical protein RXV94_05945 [Yeosuana sp. MJ-SS3]|uniref:TerB family tellurite resistance protein n=1 Tax=Gilvirhabdus luticola TaxID=3079858 RepID=A0ABU3U5K5_9FLAO|nr:hypothetical protein [Yeosuana sp. MJ-SS3]MDU8885694.1 hypothetical protein [Yeosuana sp. MJ-SS3]